MMKNEINNKEKVDLLMREKEIVRQEMLQNIKIVFSSLYSFFAVFAALLVFYYNKENVNNTPTRLYLLFFIQQIEFMVLLFNVHVNSTVMALAGYCAALEERINALSAEKVSIWESVIATQHLENPKSVQSISMSVLNAIYLLIIIYLEFLIQDTKYTLSFLIIGCIEVVLLIVMVCYFYKEKEESFTLAKRHLEN